MNKQYIVWILMLTNGDLGIKLKFLLEEKKIDRKDLADKLNKIPSNERTKKPLTEKTIQSYEAGRRDFSFIFITNLCNVLRVDIRYFSENLSNLLEKDSCGVNAFDLRKISALNIKLNSLLKVLKTISNPNVAEAIIGIVDDVKKKL